MTAPAALAGDIIRAKNTIDGATTLADAADRLEALAARLRDLDARGWTLSGPVVDDYGFLVDPTGDDGQDRYEFAEGGVW